jgi:hypothetical protein
LEVIRYHRATQESVVLSAYGERADWYWNIQAHRALEVCTGRSRDVPRYRLLEADERLAALHIAKRR